MKNLSEIVEAENSVVIEILSANAAEAMKYNGEHYASCCYSLIAALVGNASQDAIIRKVSPLEAGNEIRETYYTVITLPHGSEGKIRVFWDVNTGRTFLVASLLKYYREHDGEIFFWELCPKK